MRLPLIVVMLGYAGLLPFVAGPLWLTVSSADAPAWLDPSWLNYVTLLAAFLAGTFWGFALPAVQGPAGILGMFIASMLMLLTWLAMSLQFGTRLYALAVVFLLLLIADFWRERTLDTLPGYFALRSTLTVGALATIAWRVAMAHFPG
jgi:hypothetical protein